MGLALLLHPVLATNLVAFFVIFGVFVVAVLSLVVITLRWVIRRDRQLRAGWRQRQQDLGLTPYGIIPKGHEDDPTPPPAPGGDPGTAPSA